MSLLDKLDNYYNSRKASEVWLMVLLTAIVVGYALYTIIDPISSGYRERQESRNQELRDKIESANSYLNSITVNGDRNFYINQINRKIVKKRMAMNDLRSKLAKLDGAIKDFKSLLYTKNNWSKFLHTIAIDAKKNNLKVHSISNQYYDQNGTFAKVLDVDIKVQGEYNRILNFMNKLEQTELVANISKVTLEATDDTPKADIKLSVWGIKP